MSRYKNISNELIFRIAQDAALSGRYLVLMALSGLLATVAFASGSIPVLLGAMIVAPLMTPLGLFIFGFCGGQMKMAGRGMGTALAGLLVATLAAMATAYLVGHAGLTESNGDGTVFLGQPLFEERVRPGWYSILAGGAAGIAGTIALAHGKTDTLIGTVASLALVPAGAAGGIALMEGDPLRGLGGFVLLAMNLGLIVATGMAVVLALRPGVKHAAEVPDQPPGREDRHERTPA